MRIDAETTAPAPMPASLAAEQPGPDGAARPEAAEAPAEAPATLLAVCGIAGGAGTSTLAFLTAMYVQGHSPKPILLCDTGGPGASLAALAGRGSALSLPQAATAIAADALGVPLFVPLTARLRLIGREPDFDDAPDPDGLARLLGDARGAHPVTIVDCGTLQRPVERSVAEQASSILWVTRDGPAGARQARAALRSLPLSAEREILAVRAGGGRDAAVEHELMDAADLRGASLVFVPALPDVGRAGADAALDTAQVALEAIRARLT
jgi:Flp pilus assembly CpaE family ATPase